MLAGEAAIQYIRPRLEEYEQQGRSFLTVRTRFFDDFFRQQAHDYTQIVLMGAGMDTRAYRLSWPAHTHLYEIDQSHILHYKDTVLANHRPNCVRHSIGTDIREGHWEQLLLDQGFKPTIPSIWLFEGLLYYFDAAQVHDLFTTLAGLTTAGSWFGADLMNSTLIEDSEDKWAQYWQFGCDHPESFFAQQGWTASVLQPGDPQASYGRFTYVYPDRSVPDVSRLFLVTAYR